MGNRIYAPAFSFIHRVIRQAIDSLGTRIIQVHDTWVFVFLATWHSLYFFPITLAQRVWYTRDILGQYYPFALEYARALSVGQLPLWTTLIHAGFPLLAEGQVATFYPTRAFLLMLMPAHFALSYEMLLHLFWLACGTYLLVRGMGLGTASALLAGFIFSFSGFTLQKIQHSPILITMAWLPWLIFFQDQFQRARRDRKPSAKWFFLFSIAAGIQWLAGFPQIVVMNLMTTGLVGLFSGLFWNHRADTWRARLNAIPRVVVWTALPMLLGAGIGAIQIVPTVELIPFSIRSGDMMNEQFRTSYSLPPEFLAQFVLPFVVEDPGDSNLEYWGYVGLVTLVLAVSAPFLRRDVRTIFYATLALTALSLTLGHLNPAYLLLIRLPILDMFRVPARYLLVFTFAMVMLAAFAFEELAQRVTGSASRRTVGITALFALLTGTTIWLAYNRRIDFWLNAWQMLPFVLGVLIASVLVLVRMRRLERATFRAAIIGLTVFDLTAYAAVFINSAISTTSPAYVTEIPRSVLALGKSREHGRVLTDVFPWMSVPAIRNSLSPNTNMPYGIEHAQGGSPLVFGTHEAYISNLSPAMLNLMNVRYVMIPLELRRENSAPSPQSDLRLELSNSGLDIPPTRAIALEIASFTEGASDGETAAQLIVTFEDGGTQVFPLRVNRETANWDFGRTSGTFAPPRDARVAHSVAAFWRALGRPFDGYVYLARLDFDVPRQVVNVRIEPQIPRARFTVERVSLVDDTGQTYSLARLCGKNEFVLAYMSDTVAVWKNLDVLPRAFVVHRAQVMDGNKILGALHDPQFNPRTTVLLDKGEPLDVSCDNHDTVTFLSYQFNIVTLDVSTNCAGYLFLADTWYPGWYAFVDDRPVPLYRANAIFRAVPIEPGKHLVKFEYRPTSLVLGTVLTTISLLITISATIILAMRRL